LYRQLGSQPSSPVWRRRPAPSDPQHPRRGECRHRWPPVIGAQPLKSAESTAAFYTSRHRAERALGQKPPLPLAAPFAFSSPGRPSGAGLGFFSACSACSYPLPTMVHHSMPALGAMRKYRIWMCKLGAGTIPLNGHGSAESFVRYRWPAGSLPAGSPWHDLVALAQRQRCPGVDSTCESLGVTTLLTGKYV